MRQRFSPAPAFALLTALLLAWGAAFMPGTAEAGALGPNTGKLYQNYVTVPRGHAFDLEATGGAAITSSVPVSVQAVAQRITIGIGSGETDSTISLRVTRKSDSLYVDLVLNSGTALTAGNLYTFEWGAHRDYTYDVIVNTTTRVGFYLLEEVVAP